MDALQIVIMIFITSLAIVLFIILSIPFTACTLSYQNISTHGMATDLVDEQQEATPKIDTNAKISAY